MDANADQPMPQPVTDASGTAVWDVILADFDPPGWLRDDIAKRDEIGVARYGQRLRVHNGRSSLLDAYQEALDLLVYMKQSRLRALALESSAANELLATGLAAKTRDVYGLVLWLGALVHAKTELP